MTTYFEKLFEDKKSLKGYFFDFFPFFADFATFFFFAATIKK